jgi:hypothetical protein
MSKWISANNQLPKPGDYSVLAYFSKIGSIDMVHAEDYFADITNGIKDGKQQYTKWYISQGVTHWMPLPEPPENWEIEKEKKLEALKDLLYDDDEMINSYFKGE